MCAIFKSFWVRRLIGKPGVPYNRRLRVRGSPHPYDYDADLSLPAAESNAFHIQAKAFMNDLAIWRCSRRRVVCAVAGGGEPAKAGAVPKRQKTGAV